MKNLDKSFYIYSLKDARVNPAKTFYIGKGTGARKEDHLLKIDNTPKGKYIQEVVATGGKVIVSVLVDELTELQALRLEAELICSFGTERNGGVLKNYITPSPILWASKAQLNLPIGVYEKAKLGLQFIKEAILEFLQVNPKGIKNAEFARYLGLQSNNAGKQKDYLTYSILGLLMQENRIKKNKNGVYQIK